MRNCFNHEGHEGSLRSAHTLANRCREGGHTSGAGARAIIISEGPRAGRNLNSSSFAALRISPADARSASPRSRRQEEKRDLVSSSATLPASVRMTAVAPMIRLARALLLLNCQRTFYKPFTLGGSAGVDAPAQVPGASSLISESHRDRRESMSC